VKRGIQIAGVARSLKYREGQMGMRADRGAHRKKTRDKRVHGLRVTRAAIGLLERDRLKVYSICHRLPTPVEVFPIIKAHNLKIRDAGLKTQNYDKGLDRFVRKFNPEEEMNAMMSVYKGHYSDHGWAVHVTQKKRRCCLLDTTYGFSDEEAFWTTLTASAALQPR
jgi:hypothetical protein